MWHHVRQSGAGVKVSECIPENFENFVNLRVAREQRLASAHLGKDAASRPHVNTGRVLATTKENLRSAVPESNDLSMTVR